MSNPFNPPEATGSGVRSSTKFSPEHVLLAVNAVAPAEFVPQAVCKICGDRMRTPCHVLFAAAVAKEADPLLGAVVQFQICVGLHHAACHVGAMKVEIERRKITHQEAMAAIAMSKMAERGLPEKYPWNPHLFPPKK